MPFDAGSIAARLTLSSKQFVAGLSTAQKEVGRFDRTAGRLLSGGLVAGVLTLLGAPKKTGDGRVPTRLALRVWQGSEHGLDHWSAWAWRRWQFSLSLMTLLLLGIGSNG